LSLQIGRPSTPGSLGWTLREATPGADDDAVAALMVEYLTWAVRRLREEYGVDDPPTEPALVRGSLAAYRRPDALILLAEADGRAVGVGALRRHDARVAEVKRMYVTPDARLRHVGSAILDRLIEEAGMMGARILRLDTCRFMTDAQRLYRSRGFVERTPYPETEIPPRIQQHWLFFESRLEPSSRA
jgi:GNAT superfamily N-acetyltransferase